MALFYDDPRIKNVNLKGIKDWCFRSLDPEKGHNVMLNLRGVKATINGLDVSSLARNIILYSDSGGERHFIYS